ncbi:hypothetical protein GCM10009000_005600 [Halobacterium noricense]
MPPTARLIPSTDVLVRSHLIGSHELTRIARHRAGLRVAGALEPPVFSNRRSTRKPVLIPVSPGATLAVTRSHSQSTRNPPV